MKDFEKLRQAAMESMIRTIRLVKPEIAYHTAMGEIVKCNNYLYKILQWDGDTAYCQMLTNEELHKLIHLDRP